MSVSEYTSQLYIVLAKINVHTFPNHELILSIYTVNFVKLIKVMKQLRG